MGLPRRLTVALGLSAALHGALLGLSVPLPPRPAAPLPLSVSLGPPVGGPAAFHASAAAPAPDAVSRRQRQSRLPPLPAARPAPAVSRAADAPSGVRRTPVPDAPPAPPAGTFASSMAPDGSGNAGGHGPGAGNGSGTVVLTPARFLGDVRHPPYPERSRELGEQGRVELRVKIGADGQLLALEVTRTSGYVRLDDAAQALVRRGPFAPARRNGAAIDSWLRLGVPFRLD